MFLTVIAMQAAVTGAPAAAQTVQQRFDAATLAVEEGHCETAVPAFDALERVPGIQRNAMARATLGLRRARCLIGTDRNAEAERAIAAALPVLERSGTEFADELTAARQLLAFAAKQRGDYEGAIASNERALATATGMARVPMLLALADLTMFDHDGRALRHAEEARGLAVAPAASKDLIAAVQTVHARVLLNEGRKAEAYKMLKDSLAKQGGLTLKVSLGDLETRHDLALAALVNGDREAAQKYLAYTGAGRTKHTFGPGAQMDLPACGSEGLKPEDFAIISLSLNPDGQVAAVSPIYVGGNRATALAFTRAVRGWSWRAEQATPLPPLFRALTRVEVRCTGGVGEQFSLARILLDAVPDWSPDEAGTGTSWEGLSAAAALPRQRAALAQAGADRRARLRVLLALMGNKVLPAEEWKAVGKEALVLATALDAPPPLRLLLTTLTTTDKVLPQLIGDPVLNRDPLTAAAMRVSLAADLRDRKSRVEAGALLDAAIAQPGLPERHPVKVRALLLKANMLGADGDIAGAKAALARTGLSAEQCAIAGPVPAIRRTGASDNAFPNAAYALGFEGWVRTEFDIAANGRTIAPRTVVAYPPFVFNEAATGISTNARFASSFQPDAPVACAANTQTINFRLPD